MPVVAWVFLGVFILLVLGGAVVILATDWKRRPFVISDRDLQTAPPVVIESHSVDPVELASAAIRTIGGEEVAPSRDGLRVAGWIGSAWTNIPSRQQYQLLVDVRSSPAGYEFRCFARPRFSSALVGASRSGVLAGKLREALTGSASSRPTT